MARNTFKASYFGTPVFSCRLCTRRTRDTGDNGGVELCPECNERCMTENGLSDNGAHMTPAERATDEAYIAKMAQEAVNKGGKLAGYTKTK